MLAFVLILFVNTWPPPKPTYLINKPEKSFLVTAQVVFLPSRPLPCWTESCTWNLIRTFLENQTRREALWFGLLITVYNSLQQLIYTITNKHFQNSVSSELLFYLLLIVKVSFISSNIFCTVFTLSTPCKLILFTIFICQFSFCIQLVPCVYWPFFN